MKEKLFIIDGTALLYRSHFAFIKNPLINSKGHHTSALYGTISSFVKLYEDFQPRYIAVAFDTKEKTFRHDLFTEYKANRAIMPDELITQIKPIHTFFNLSGVKEISIPGFEADDLIGSLAKKYENLFDIVIVSNDKDFSQLVNESICIYDPKQNEFIYSENILNKYEVQASQFIDYLALVGDSSDNIPGAKGIGPKTAVRLLKDFTNIDYLYNQLDNVSNAKEKEKLLTSKNNVYLSKVLATIKTDIDLTDIDVDSLRFNVNNLYNTFEFLDSFELRNLKKSFLTKFSTISFSTESEPQESVKNESGDDTVEKVLIKNIEHLQLVISSCNSDIIAIDTETTSTSAMEAELVGISFCFSKISAYYIPINHTFSDNLDWQCVLPLIKKLLINKTIIGHNIKYDIHVLQRHGLIINDEKIAFPQIFDTMLAAYLLDPGRNEYSLDDCAKRELDLIMQPITELIGKGKNQISFATVDINTACTYSAEDAYATYCLYHIYEKKLKDLNLYELYKKIEVPLIFTLCYMEKQGVYVDVSELSDLSNEITEQIDELIKKIYAIAAEVFNINSPQQLAHILFNKLKIPPVKKTQSGFSTDIEVLETLAIEHEIAKYLIEYRHLTKMKNTYIDSLPTLVNPITKKIHTSFNQTITSTGRLSSSNPNLQNIPIKTELGKKIRKAFKAKENSIILAADYSQIELRLLAMLSNDESMINAFKQGVDIHTNTAQKIFNKENIDNLERSKAKTINFGIIYGMGANSLSKALSITFNDAKDFINNYFNNFPTIQAYIEKQRFNAHQNGYVETIFKRRLYLPEINAQNQRIVSEAERIATNMPIQGSAADIIKIAMINIYNKIKERSDIKMLIQVHDELVFEIDKEVLVEAKEIIKYEMENALSSEICNGVSLIVDIKEGNNWGF